MIQGKRVSLQPPGLPVHLLRRLLLRLHSLFPRLIFRLRGVHEFLTAISEAFQRWDQDPEGASFWEERFPPYQTPKGIPMFLPFLMRSDVIGSGWEPAEIIVRPES